MSLVFRKVNGILFSLRSEAHALPMQVRRQLVVSLIFPNLDYVAVVFSHLSLTLNSKLAKLQNRCIRPIYGLKRNAPTYSYTRELGWLSIAGRRTQLLALQLFKLLNRKRPVTLYERFNKYFADPTPGLRPTTYRPFKIPVPNTSAFAGSFIYKAMVQWNSLPVKVRDAESLDSFLDSMHDLIFKQEERI